MRNSAAESPLSQHTVPRPSVAYRLCDAQATASPLLSLPKNTLTSVKLLLAENNNE